MNISKFQLKEFKLLKKDDLITENSINTSATSNQDNLITEPPFSEIIEEPTDEVINEPESSQEKIEHHLHKVEIEDQLLEQNKLLGATLNDIKGLLIDIEKQQESRFSELSNNILMFIKNLITKIISNPIISKIITENILSHINEILNKVKSNSSLNVKIPNDLGENLKLTLIQTFKNTASKLNIEVIEHHDENKNITIEWEDGKAELEIDNPIKEIEGELSKYDTKS